MTTAAVPSASSQPATPPVSSTPPSGVPTDAGRFSHSPDVPEWARGRTKEEVLTMTKGMVESFGRAGYPTPVNPMGPAPVVPSPAAPALDLDAYITGKDAMAIADRIVQQMRGEQQPGSDQASSAVYGLASMKHPKEFAKYGPEIQTYLARVPKQNWTLDAVELAVKLVKADHMDDYRAEWQSEAVAKMEPTMRSIGNAGSAPVPEDKSLSLESEKIPADWKVRAAQAGLTMREVEEFCRTNEMSVPAFFKLFDSGKVVTEVT